jgi:hypothetical protein
VQSGRSIYRKYMSWRHDRKMGGRVDNSIVE